MLFKYLIYLFMVTNAVNSARILAIFWTPYRNHYDSGVPLLKALARKGHEVNLLSTFFDDNVYISTYNQTLIRGIFGLVPHEYRTVYQKLSIVSLPQDLEVTAEYFWKNQAVQDILRSKEKKYDVVICLSFYSDHIFPIAHHLGAPLILYRPDRRYRLDNKYIGAPYLPYYRKHAYGDTTLAGYRDRIGIMAYTGIQWMQDKIYITATHEKLTAKFLKNPPKLSELNVSLIFVNTHIALEAPRPYVPNMIPIGGHYSYDSKIHLKEEKYLDLLNSADDGFVVFTMGPHVKLEKYFDLNYIVRIFREYADIKFLIETRYPVYSQIENVIIIDEIDSLANILNHPLCKLIISNGELDILTEAVYHGVPLLGIPFTREQRDNLYYARNCGFALKLDYKDVTTDSFVIFLSHILRNFTIKKNIMARSAVFKNQSIEPLQHGVWWVEHIIEHQGGDHLRNVAVDIEWYKIYMVEMAFLVFAFVVTSVGGYGFLVPYVMTNGFQLPPDVIRSIRIVMEYLLMRWNH